MPGPKLNEAPVLRRRPQSRSVAVRTPVLSARAVAKYVRISPYKVREVLDLIRGYDAERAADILKFCERDAAIVVGKLLASAVANAEHDHALVGDELFVSACVADEGPTLKRWRPRARGRATRIRKRTCHVTVIVSRRPDRELQERRARRAQTVVGDRRRRRTGGGEATDEATVDAATDEPADETPAAPVAEAPAEPVAEAPAEEAPAEEAPAEEAPAADETPADAGDEEKSE